MKTRNGFVSNSSSSSFVVAAKKGSTKIKLVIEVDIADFADHTILNVKQLDKYLDDDGLEKDECSWYGNAVKALKEGKAIYKGWFADDSDKPLEVFLCSHGIPQETETDDFKILESEGGY